MDGLTAGFRRVVGRLRLDRETLLTLTKAVVAATIAWVLATRLFGAEHATFAAFSAVMLTELTVVDSVAKAVRYIAAMLGGIALVGGAVWMWGIQLWLFPIMLLVGLAIGRWHRLGAQGVNVAVAAIFAYGAFASPGPSTSAEGPLPEIAGMVLLGAVVALVVTLVVAPPLRYRSARYAVDSLSGSLAELLTDMADGLAGDAPTEQVTKDWQWRADGLPNKATQARETVDHAMHTTKFNPRRLLVRDHTCVAGHRATIHVFERIAGQLASVTTGLVRAVERDEEPRPHHDAFLHRYGALLLTVRDAVAAAGAMHTEDDFAGEPLAEESRRCGSALEELGRHAAGYGLDQPTQWAIYGGLYIDAQRLCEEIQSARDAYPDVSVRTVRR